MWKIANTQMMYDYALTKISIDPMKFFCRQMSLMVHLTHLLSPDGDLQLQLTLYVTPLTDQQMNAILPMVSCNSSNTFIKIRSRWFKISAKYAPRTLTKKMFWRRLTMILTSFDHWILFTYLFLILISEIKAFLFRRRLTMMCPLCIIYVDTLITKKFGCKNNSDKRVSENLTVRNFSRPKFFQSSFTERMKIMYISR